MSKIFFLINCLLVLSVTNGYSYLYEKQPMASEKELLKEYNNQDQDSIKVIRNLLVFIIKNNHCFTDDKLYTKLTALLKSDSKNQLEESGNDTDLNNKRSLYMSKYQKNKNLNAQIDSSSFHDNPTDAVKRKMMTIDKKGYDYGTILYIGKRSQQKARKGIILD